MPSSPKPGGRKKPPASSKTAKILKIIKATPPAISSPKSPSVSTEAPVRRASTPNSTVSGASTRSRSSKAPSNKIPSLLSLEVARPSASSPTPSRALSSRRSSLCSNASSSSSINCTILTPKIYRYVIRNIPDNIKSQREFFKILVTSNLPIVNLKVNYNKTALVECKTAAPPNFQTTLRNLVGTPTISFAPLNRHAHRSAATENNKSKVSYSCVIKSVDQEYTLEEIELILREQGINFHKCWRIISRATGKPTSLLRVITHSKTSMDHLLLKGVRIYGRIHTVEPSKVPQPIQKYCTTCTKSGHDRTECTDKPTCATCGNTHKNTICPNLKNPTCPNCKGNHPAWDMKCPKRSEPPKAPENTAPIRVLNEIEPIDDNSYEHFSRVDSMIKFITQTLSNVFPDKRLLIAKVIERASADFLNRTTVINYTGGRISIAMAPINYFGGERSSQFNPVENT
ncbi:hypothetical protein WA026_010064 [Henosepilachna vigintioctopunctata]|uniref:Gag-like protein n=1 Tax=Henosepilachna vigintioctopunctata TaxID=420089 RepID=A0AAW1UC16_9CUCU